MGAAKKLKSKPIPANPFDVLSPQHADFVREYVKDFNATQAAIRARYSKKSAYSQGARLLKNAGIRRAVDWLIERRAKPDSLSAQEARKRILTATLEAYDRAVATGDIKAQSSLLTLMSRQHGMLTDKLVTEDAKTEEIAETERAELAELARLRLSEAYKLRAGQAGQTDQGDRAGQAASSKTPTGRRTDNDKPVQPTGDGTPPCPPAGPGRSM